LKEAYAKLPMMIHDNKVRQHIQDILNSGMLSSQQKIEHIEKIINVVTRPGSLPDVDFFAMMEYINSKHVPDLFYPYENCVALYFTQEGKLVHGAIVQEILPMVVESKWGTLPVMFKHKLRDVPTTYGSIVRFYPPDLLFLGSP
jgi:hypothetical protein